MPERNTVNAALICWQPTLARVAVDSTDLGVMYPVSEVLAKSVSMDLLPEE